MTGYEYKGLGWPRFILRPRLCLCGCGATPKYGQWLRGHNNKTKKPAA